MSSNLRLTWIVLLALWPTGVAHAWTDARARAASVVVELEGDSGFAQVRVDVELQVRGGWLEGYEISGLDPDAELDSLKAPVLVGEDGEKWAPRARMRQSGRLSLAFERRGAPRKGLYHLRFGYRTRLLPRATEEGGSHVAWTLPAWRTGLDEAEVWLWWPSQAGNKPVLADAADAELRQVGGRWLIRFHRLHVPRATPWTVGFELRGPGGRAAPGAAGGSSTGAWAARPDFAGVCTALLALCAMAFVQRRRAAQDEVSLVYALGGRTRSLVAAAVLLVFAGWLNGAAQWGVAMAAALSCAGVRRRGAGPLQFGAWRRVGARERAAARRQAWRDVLGLERHPDPLSGAGLLVLAGLAAWAAWGPPGARPALVWVATVFTVGCASSSRRWGGDHNRMLASVFGLASQLRLPGVALSVRAFFPAHGRPRQPRLAVLPCAPVSGLLRLEVGAMRAGCAPFVVLATVKAGSGADRWLSDLGSHRVQSTGAKRACHQWSAADAEAVEERLQELLGRCAQRAHEAVSRAA